MMPQRPEKSAGVSTIAQNRTARRLRCGDLDWHRPQE